MAQIDFKDKWVLWAHLLNDKDWSLKSYKRLYEIENSTQFWKVYNNIHKFGLGIAHYFLMKDGVNPTWEDPHNRDGGICSIQIDNRNVSTSFEDFSARLVLDLVGDNINGISISPKTKWYLIKVWNGDGADLTKKMHKEIYETYNGKSIKYKKNNPEY